MTFWSAPIKRIKFNDLMALIGGQGWIRTSVRKTGQIYSLLPLTTRPPVHIFVRGIMCLHEGRSRRRSSPMAKRPLPVNASSGKGGQKLLFSCTGTYNVFT